LKTHSFFTQLMLLLLIFVCDQIEMLRLDGMLVGAERRRETETVRYVWNVWWRIRWTFSRNPRTIPRCCLLL